MKGGHVLASVFCAVVTICALHPAGAQTAGKDEPSAVGWQDAAVNARAGAWDVTTTYTMEGLTVLEQDHAVSERSVDDGLVLVDEIDGTMLQKPYLGEGRSGYDPETGRYWMSWTDWTDSTAVSTVTFYGIYDPATTSYIYQAVVTDPVMGEALMQITWTIDGPDRETVIYTADSGELGPIEVMRSVYQRQPEPMPLPSAGGDPPSN